MNPRCVIFDIDGTLADCEHRRHLVDHTNYEATGKEDWDEFKRRCVYDKPIDPIANLLRQIYCGGAYVVLCTSRSADQRLTTVIWLTKHSIPFDALYMRADEDYRPDHIVKKEMLASIRKNFDIWFVVDDRQSVVDMWRAEGLTCLQCAPGNF